MGERSVLDSEFLTYYGRFEAKGSPAEATLGILNELRQHVQPDPYKSDGA